MTRYAKWGCVGDSITWGVGSTNPDRRSYPAVAGVPRIGRPGQCLTIPTYWPAVWDPFTTTFPGDIQTMLGLGVTVIVAEIGINELQVGTADDVLTAAYTSLQAMGKPWGVRVILSPITPFGKGNTSVTKAIHDQRVRINNWVRTNHRYYVDYAKALGGGTMTAANDSGDHLHPSNTGHKAMAATLTAFMTKHRWKA